MRRVARDFLTIIRCGVRIAAMRRPTGMKIIKMVSPAFSLAVISLATLWLRPGIASAGETTQAQSPQLAPGWELPDLDGKIVHSTDFKDKVVVLDFWATWCPPCRAEISDFIELQKKYAVQGLMVIGVSVDQSGLKTVKAFAQKTDINYPIVLADGKIVDAFGGIDVLPTTFIIDRTGHVVKQHLGFTSSTVMEKEIKTLLLP
jgi:thiol-disulfide isomerase/thioredoxin